jgi:hypothetical protein
MDNEPVSSSAICEAALKVFSRAEIAKLTKMQLSNFVYMVEMRLKEPGPPPTVDELEGLKEILLEHLSHPALDKLLTQSQTSETTRSATSA